MLRNVPHSLLALGGLLLAASLLPAQITFDPALSVPAGTRPGGLAVLDVNGDGLLDQAVAVDGPDRIQFLLQSPGGAWSLGGSIFLPAGSGPGDVLANDLDADGDSDLLVVLSDTNQLASYINLGFGNFSAGPAVAVGVEPRHVAALDFDLDGDLDFAVTARDSNDVSFVLNAFPALTLSQRLVVGAEPRHLAAGDLDGDGSPELAVAVHDARRIVVLDQVGAAWSVAASFTPALNEKPGGIVLVDQDGDSLLDVVATGGNGFNGLLSIHRNLGGLSFGGAVPQFLPAESDAALVADFDADGLMDVAVASEDASMLYVLPGTATPGFGATITLGVGLRPEALVAADLDGDGDQDLLSANRDSNSVSVLRNTASVPPVSSLTITSVVAPGPGIAGQLRLNAPGEAGSSYVAAFSGANTPGIPTGDGRIIPLAFDLLLLFSQDPNNGVFFPSAGVLSGTDEALVNVVLPNQPLLRGQSFFVAFVTVDGLGVIRSISGAERIVLQ